MSNQAAGSTSDQASSSNSQSRKRRPALSCDPCINRKVKCDRMSPCRACSLRGEAEQCVYRLTTSSRKAITQLEEINRLRAELERTKTSRASPSSSSNTALDIVPKSPASRYPETEGLVGRLIDSIGADLRFPWAGWISNVAVEARNDKPTLSDALLAISMARCGALDDKRDMQLHGHNLYISTLARLQGDLYDPSRASQPEVLYATMLLSLYELIVLNDPISWLTHVHGVGRLIQYRGPARHANSLEHQTFIFFRLLGVTLHVLLRTPSFLAQPEWKNIPWSHSYPSKSIIDLIVDILTDIPTLFTLGDELENDMAALPSSQHSQSHMPSSLQTQAAAATIAQRKEHLEMLVHAFESSLEKWRHDWVHTYPGIPAGSAPPTIPLTSLAALCQPILARDAVLAQALNLYHAAHLLLLRVRAGFGQRPLHPPADLVRLVCDTAEAQLSAERDYFSALAMIFPLRVAFCTPAAAPTDARRAAHLFAALEAKFGFHFVPHILSALPGFGGSITLEGAMDETPGASASSGGGSSGGGGMPDGEMEGVERPR